MQTGVAGSASPGWCPMDMDDEGKFHSTEAEWAAANLRIASEGMARPLTPPKWRWTVGFEFPWGTMGTGQPGVRYFFLEDGVANSAHGGGNGRLGKLDLLT